MNYLNMILKGLAFAPTVIHSVEGLFGKGTGAQKKDAAIAMVGTAINLTDAIANKQVLDPNGFQGGLGKVIDGVVDCLNASVWAKKQA